MSRTSETIANAKARKENVLIGYFPAGFPSVKESIEACIAMCEAGVDVLELGVPYSDPVMDGLVIQQATETALANGFKLRDLTQIIEGITSKVDTPVLVMSYWNPVIRFGVQEFAKTIKAAGATGLITPDLIPDEASQWLTISEDLGLDRVFLATPSSSQERLVQAAESSRGFVYGVSTMGITGTREDLDIQARAVVSGVRTGSSSVPVCVGIGISTPEQVAEVNSYADGAIVGSAFIKAYNAGGIEALVRSVKTMKEGAQS